MHRILRATVNPHTKILKCLALPVSKMNGKAQSLKQWITRMFVICRLLLTITSVCTKLEDSSFTRSLYSSNAYFDLYPQ